MLLEMVAIIKQHLPSHITLHKVFLRETATSFAEWHAEDN
jgi:6-pyruvoyltetrahydropterin/6-carboxytetrahydropterin synthase